MRFFERIVLLLLLSLLASSFRSPDAAARFYKLPPGWSDELRDEIWIVRSPRDAQGSVDFVMPLVIPYEGDFQTWFSVLAPLVATTLGGRIVSQQPPGTTIGAERTDGIVLSMRMVAEDASGRRSNVIVAAYRADTVKPELAGRAQVLAIIAPSDIAEANDEKDRRWLHAIKYAENIVLRSRLILTPEFIAHVRAVDARNGDGPGGQKTTNDPQPAPLAELQNSGVWSARSGGQGIVYLSPCRADQLPILAGIRRRVYVPGVDLPALARDETRDAVSAWTGGAVPTFGGQEQEADSSAIVARWRLQGRDFASWFAVRRRSDNHMQVGFVVLPADRGQDRAVGDAVATVRAELENESTGELALEGQPQPAGTDTGVEAVLTLSGLALSEENRRLSLQSSLVALYKNGSAVDTERKLKGRWRRLDGAYEVDFTDVGGYAARLSTSCLTDAVVTKLPPAPTGQPRPTETTGETPKGCRFEMVRKTSYQIFCGTVPGTVAPRTCPPPSSTWEKQMVCD